MKTIILFLLVMLLIGCQKEGDQQKPANTKVFHPVVPKKIIKNVLGILGPTSYTYTFNLDTNQRTLRIINSGKVPDYTRTIIYDSVWRVRKYAIFYPSNNTSDTVQINRSADGKEFYFLSLRTNTVFQTLKTETLANNRLKVICNNLQNGDKEEWILNSRYLPESYNLSYGFAPGDISNRKYFYSAANLLDSIQYNFISNGVQSYFRSDSFRRTTSNAGDYLSTSISSMFGSDMPWANHEIVKFIPQFLFDYSAPDYLADYTYYTGGTLSKTTIYVGFYHFTQELDAKGRIWKATLFDPGNLPFEGFEITYE